MEAQEQLQAPVNPHQVHVCGQVSTNLQFPKMQDSIVILTFHSVLCILLAKRPFLCMKPILISPVIVSKQSIYFSRNITLRHLMEQGV